MEFMKIGGVSVHELKEKYGDALYIYDEAKIEKQFKDYKECFKSGQFACDILYASKAFTCISMLEKVLEADCSLDVVSGGELYVAMQAKFPAERIYFHGNNKTDEELAMALRYGVHTIVIDNLHEIDEVIRYSDAFKQEVHVLIRINPHVEAHTHEYIVTASPDSKFGISIDKKAEIVQMIHQVQASAYVVFDGFHSHIGSQIFEEQAFIVTIDKMVRFMKELEAESIFTKVFNLGGGYGVRYIESDQPIATPSLCKTLIHALEDATARYGVALEKACLEPGRSIVGEAGYSLYTVGFIKATENKKFLFINGGMSDNIRPALYQAQYACDLANKMDMEKTHHYVVAGKCCETGDILIQDALLPEAQSGDLLVVYTTGAYGYSMASNYNRLNRLPVVFVKEGCSRLVIRGETYADQMLLDVRSASDEI